MKLNLVSIIMPSFNCENYLHESVNSILRQSYKEWELIIVDDCSTDRSAEIGKQYTLQDSRIRCYSMDHNSGPAAARNKAIDKSRGQYIAFLDSDDIWAPEKLETQIREMQKCNAVFCFTGYTPFKTNGRSLPTFQVPNQICYNKLLYGSVIGCLTVVYDASIIGKRYFSDGADLISQTIYSKLLTKIGHEDYAAWLNIIKDIDDNKFQGKKAIGINKSLAHYRLSDNSFSSNKKKSALYQWLIYRKHQKIGLFKSIFYFASYTINGLIKY